MTSTSIRTAEIWTHLEDYWKFNKNCSLSIHTFDLTDTDRKTGREPIGVPVCFFSPTNYIFMRTLFIIRMFCTWGLFLTSVLTFGQISNPVLESIEKSDLSVEITDLVTIPQSSSSPPRARINHLKAPPDNSGRLFVNDLSGQLHVIEGSTSLVYLNLELETNNFVDSPGLGTGFTSFDFHPDFANNGLFYTAHSESGGSGQEDLAPPIDVSISLQGVITEWRAFTPSSPTFFGLKREILRIDIPGTIHVLGEISFNPTANPGDSDYGMLYICLGDGGSTIRGEPNNTQRLDSPLGTIIRMDPLGTNGRNGRYGIPADNPFAQDGDPNTLDEIWAFGFRNPHRISWDTATGQMYVADIGERNIQEVNLVTSGSNYGWNEREGTFFFNANFANDPSAGTRDDVFALPEDDVAFGFTYPVAQYDRDEGRAIVLGPVYWGSQIPELRGLLLFGDIVNGRIFYVDTAEIEEGQQAPISELTLKQNDKDVTLLQLVGGGPRADLRFGFDEDGEIFMLTKVDGIVRTLSSTDTEVILDGSGDSPDSFKNILHPNGIIFDQVLLSGSSVTVKAGPTQITRVSFVDLNNDIVQVEFSGSGTCTIELDSASVSGPALPANYNQNINYMKGHARVTIDGADADTNVSIFSVGPVTILPHVNGMFFKDGVTYNGRADLASLTINGSSINSILFGNAVFSGDSGDIGVIAPNLAVQTRMVLLDMDASGSAIPKLQIGANSPLSKDGGKMLLVGGDLVQSNGADINVVEGTGTSAGFQSIELGANIDAHGNDLPAVANLNGVNFVNGNGAAVTVSSMPPIK